jgi:hypothetical protein
MRFLSRDQSVSRISEVDLHRHPITRSPPRRPPGRYRDLMLCVVFSGGEGLRIIGEVQVRRRRALRMWKRLIPSQRRRRRASERCDQAAQVLQIIGRSRPGGTAISSFLSSLF